MGWVIGCPLSYNHCQGTQIEPIKKIFNWYWHIWHIYVCCIGVLGDRYTPTHTDVHIYMYIRKTDVCLSSSGFQVSYTNFNMTLTSRQRGLIALYHLCYRQSLPDLYLSFTCSQWWSYRAITAFISNGNVLLINEPIWARNSVLKGTETLCTWNLKQSFTLKSSILSAKEASSRMFLLRDHQ